MISDVLKDKSFAKTVDMDSGFHTRSILCSPLIVNNECIGALELLNKKMMIYLMNKIGSFHQHSLLMPLWRYIMHVWPMH